MIQVARNDVTSSPSIGKRVTATASTRSAPSVMTPTIGVAPPSWTSNGPSSMPSTWGRTRSRCYGSSFTSSHDYESPPRLSRLWESEPFAHGSDRVPCSSSATIRRHPVPTVEAHLHDPAMVDALANRQNPALIGNTAVAPALFHIVSRHSPSLHDHALPSSQAL